ncbi:sugar phosphate isomerase/epimerase family protein [Streptomyces sp. BH105]|uniref:sugar phosphate isomerase/epimerase family protein n=1 Tax=Streptomyces sp. BH105 TaxID=3410408 RepID=UPI003CF9BADF
MSVIDRASAAGLESIEWGSDVHVPAGCLALARDVGERTRAAGLAVCSYGSYLRFPWQTREENGSDVVATAQALRAPRIRVWAGPCGSAEADEDTWAATTSALHDVAVRAQAAGIELAVEFHLATLADTATSTRRLLADIGLPTVSTYWQPRVGASDRDALTDLDVLGEDVSTIHVFSWGDQFERHPLRHRRALWRAAITRAVRLQGVTDLLLEFLPDDDAGLLPSEAAALRDWLDTAMKGEAS